MNTEKLASVSAAIAEKKPDRALFLAIDAGGTKADYLLADASGELARARSGSIKRMRVDAATAAKHLDAALEDLERQSGVSLAAVQRTCVGTAGNTVALVADWLREEIRARVGGELVIVGDVEIALDAAFQGGPGVLVLAGTGSNVAGRAPDGTLLGAGGWGPLMADQGSANRIGLSGLRAGFLAKDEGRSMRLLEAARQFWQLASEDELIAYANSVPPPDFSKLAETVHQLAVSGDEVAAEVLQREGAELGYLVRLVLRRMHGAGTQLQSHEEEFAIAFAGSIMEKVPAVRAALLEEVRREFAGVRALEGVVDSLQGALWRARRGNAADLPG